MRVISDCELAFVDGGKCGPLSTGDKIEAAVVHVVFGPIGLAIWARAYYNACA